MGTAQIIAIMMIVLLVAFMGYAGVRQIDQSRTIRKLSETCATAQSGETLITSVRYDEQGRPSRLECIYSSDRGYGRSKVTRSRNLSAGEGA